MKKKPSMKQVHAYRAGLPKALWTTLNGYTCLKIAEYYLEQYNQTKLDYYEDYAEHFLNIGVDSFNDEDCLHLLAEHFEYLI